MDRARSILEAGCFIQYLVSVPAQNHFIHLLKYKTYYTNPDYETSDHAAMLTTTTPRGDPTRNTKSQAELKAKRIHKIRTPRYETPES